MKKATWKKTSFAEKIVEIIRTSPSINEMREQLQDYHDNDIAQSLQCLNRAERNLLYSALDAEWLAEIISYLDDPAEYIDEIGIDKLAEILNEMDADDAVDLPGGNTRLYGVCRRLTRNSGKAAGNTHFFKLFFRLDMNHITDPAPLLQTFR